MQYILLIVLIATRLDRSTPIWHYFSMKNNNHNAYNEYPIKIADTAYISEPELNMTVSSYPPPP